MKKKLIFGMLLVSLLLIFTGCTDLMNTPTKRVEELFSKYQTLDKDITKEIDTLVKSENLTDEEANRYRNIIEKQYKMLVYNVKDEKIDGDNATVTVQIEVLDYKSAIQKVDLNYQDDNYDKVKYTKDKLDALEQTKDKVTYTIEVPLVKKNKKWQVSNLSNDDLKKIQGMY